MVRISRGSDDSSESCPITCGDQATIRFEVWGSCSTGVCMFAHLRPQNRRLRGSLGATLNREIGFVSSSFSFRAWRACERARRSCECVRGAECSSSRWPQLWEVLLRSSRPLREAQDVVYTWVLRRNGSKSGPRCSHCMCFTWVLSRCFIKPVCGACFS